MREIKFRAWNTETNKMIINLKEMGVFALQSIYSIDEFLVIPTNEKYPLMQYTGLKDVNGVEIYEGDILKSDINETFGFVAFEDGKFVVNWEDIIEDLFEWTGEFVIGNIYENPELLKED